MENNMIELCAKLSKEVYSNCTEIGDLGYSITKVKDTLVVAIRGTANLKNAGRDINVIPWKFGGFFSTLGFVRAFKKLEGHVLGELEKNKKVIFTGHSLGGALATLFAEKMGASCVTFGSPRVYFKGFYKSTINHLRFYFEDDPIPMIPKLLYCHKNEGIKLLDGDSSSEVVDVEDHRVVWYLWGVRKWLEGNN